MCTRSTVHTRSASAHLKHQHFTIEVGDRIASTSQSRGGSLLVFYKMILLIRLLELVNRWNDIYISYTTSPQFDGVSNTMGWLELAQLMVYML